MDTCAKPESSPAPVAAPTTFARWSQRFFFWAPVWLPLVVLTQLALLGLGPALAERRRLAHAEHELDVRLEREQLEQAALERASRAQDDPIYLERERRNLRATQAAPESAGR